MIACFSSPSFHEGSASCEAAVCANARIDARGPNRIGIKASVEIMRAAMLECGPALS